jgi:hypothetical protein
MRFVVPGLAWTPIRFSNPVRRGKCRAMRASLVHGGFRKAHANEL